MKPKVKHFLAACAVAVLGSVQSSAPQRMGNYDFSYEINGTPKVLPVQVFDDGISTFFQFRPGEPIPAIFVNGPNGPVMQTPEMQGPYARVSGVGSTFTLRIGYGTGQVIYAGGERATGQFRPAGTGQPFVPGQVAPNPQVANYRPTIDRMVASVGPITSLPRSAFFEDPSPKIALDVNSYATPIKGDLTQFDRGNSPSGSKAFVRADEAEVPFGIGATRLGPIGTKAVVQQAKAFASGDRIEITGRNDASVKDGLADKRAKSVADMLAANGVPQTAILSKTTEKVFFTKLASAASGVTITVFHNQPGALNPTAPEPRTGFQEAQINTWMLRSSDATVQRLLQRWADDAGWKLIWKNAPEVKITGDAELVRDGFVAASDYLISQARTLGYHIKGRAFTNKILVVSGE